MRPLGDLLASIARAEWDGDLVVRERDGARHRIVLRRGRIVAVRVAGRFDPLLDLLHRTGALDADALGCALEALGRSERRSGELAVEHGRAPPEAVQRALDAQTRARLHAVFEIAERRGADAWFERRPVGARDAAASVPYLDAVRGKRRARDGPGGAPMQRTRAPPRACDRGLARRELRRLARRLHPDLHSHLDPAAREALASALAEATAAYHRLR